MHSACKQGENCALDALNFCLGDDQLIKVPDLTATSKELYGEREMPSLQIITQTLRMMHLPFELQKVKLGRGPVALHTLLTKTEGIFLMLCDVNSGGARGGGTLVGHFFGVDCWRKIIYDNDKDESSRYCQWDVSDTATPQDALNLFKQIGLVQLKQVYVVKVLASRRGETSYFGN